MSTMTKSQLDWGKFKETEGKEFEHELVQNTKSGYLDKVAFLQRADERQFEQERAVRMKRRKTDTTNSL